MGVLDGFDASAATDEYAGYLSARDVAPAGQIATIFGFGHAKFDDGTKPYVILHGAWKKDGSPVVAEEKRALILKRANGQRLAAWAQKVGGEGALIGKQVDVKLGVTEFRGKPVATVDLFPRSG